MTLRDDNRVARVVVEVRGRRAPTGRGRALVAHPRTRHEHDRETGATNPQRPLDILDIEEERLVE